MSKKKPLVNYRWIVTTALHTGDINSAKAFLELAQTDPAATPKLRNWLADEIEKHLKKGKKGTR